MQSVARAGEAPMTIPTWPVRVDGKPPRAVAAPHLGQHTDAVLADWLAMDANATAALRAEGVVGPKGESR